jgi:uncharacterized protein YlxP (DUF503 family)
MVVGVLRLEVHIPAAQSLKDKRAVLRRVKDQLRGRFNIAVAEVDASDRWQRAMRGVAAVGGDQPYVQGLVNEVTAWVRGTRVVELIRVDEEYISAEEGDHA